MCKIKAITNTADLTGSLAVIRNSFRTVAAQLKLTPENCPGHSAFITMDKLLDLHNKAACFGLYADNTQVGFAAAEKGNDGRTFYLDKLAVVPGQRHKGYGDKLVKFVVAYVEEQGGKSIALGMIDSLTGLKEWYKSLGFKETGTKKFDHLPFLVCLMELDLSAQKVK